MSTATDRNHTADQMPWQKIRFQTASSFIDDHPTLSEPIIDGLCRRGEVVNVIGSTKEGKSWLILGMALSIAAGRPWLGRDVTQGRVALIDNELQPGTLSSRIRTVAHALTIPEDTLTEDVLVLSLRGNLILLVVSDFDPDGDEIAESLARSIRDDFAVDDVVAHKILLRQDQVRDWDLPPNAVEAKESSSRYAKFFERYESADVYELEAIPPELMQSTIQDAIEATINVSAFNAELAQEKADAATLQAMRSEVIGLFCDMFQNDEFAD